MRADKIANFIEKHFVEDTYLIKPRKEPFSSAIPRRWQNGNNETAMKLFAKII